MKFVFKFSENTSPFCRATDTPFLTSGDVSSGFQSKRGQPYLYMGTWQFSSTNCEVSLLHLMILVFIN